MSVEVKKEREPRVDLTMYLVGFANSDDKEGIYINMNPNKELVVISEKISIGTEHFKTDEDFKSQGLRIDLPDLDEEDDRMSMLNYFALSCAIIDELLKQGAESNSNL